MLQIFSPKTPDFFQNCSFWCLCEGAAEKAEITVVVTNGESDAKNFNFIISYFSTSNSGNSTVFLIQIFFREFVMIDKSLFTFAKSSGEKLKTLIIRNSQTFDTFYYVFR